MFVRKIRTFNADEIDYWTIGQASVSNSLEIDILAFTNNVKCLSLFLFADQHISFPTWSDLVISSAGNWMFFRQDSEFRLNWGKTFERRDSFF